MHKGTVLHDGGGGLFLGIQCVFESIVFFEFSIFLDKSGIFWELKRFRRVLVPLYLLQNLLTTLLLVTASFLAKFIPQIQNNAFLPRKAKIWHPIPSKSVTTTLLKPLEIFFFLQASQNLNIFATNSTIMQISSIQTFNFSFLILGIGVGSGGSYFGTEVPNRNPRG